MQATNPSPTFSIVMPVLNGMPWLPEAVSSILGQEAVGCELVVLDAGSTDGSREWLQRHVADRATLVFEPDAGQTDALLRGFRLATGRFWGWLNADDVLEPDALARVAEVFAASPRAPAVSGCCLQIDAGGAIVGVIPTPPGGDLAALLAHPHNLAQPATFFRAERYREVGGLDPTLQLAMDVDLWMKLAATGPVALLPDRVLARFRIHASARSVTGATKTVREDLQVRLRHGMRRPSRAWWMLVKQAYLRPLKRVIRRRRAPRATGSAGDAPS